MTSFFFYGTLCHAPLLELVLGRRPVTEPASLADHAVHLARGEAFPVIVPRPGATATGILVHDLTPGDVARLDFYEGGFDCFTRSLEIGARRIPARVYFAAPGRWEPGAPWDLGAWAAAHGAVVLATAADFMALYGQKPAAEVIARYRQMLARGASRLRARPGTNEVRRAVDPGDVVLEARHEPYARFFSVEEYDLRHRRFSGEMSAAVNRAVFVSGDAAVVLPYDPRRDRVLVVEQFRAGPLGRGDPNPWLLEAIAGRVDPFETPEQCARREAQEEARLDLDRLLPVAQYYPSSGATTEFLHAYVALADLPDTAAGLAGVESEAEDIRAHVLTFERLMALIVSGEAASGPLMLLAYWLAGARGRLRAGA